MHAYMHACIHTYMHMRMPPLPSSGCLPTYSMYIAHAHTIARCCLTPCTTAATFLEQAVPSHPELRLPTHSATGLCSGGRRHLVVCVHGLEGNQYDLRLVRLQLQKAFPRMVFMMSSANTSNTHASFSHMADLFVAELDAAIKKHAPRRVSFIGHSLGNLIIRSALARPEVQAMFNLSGRRAANPSPSKSTADGPAASSRDSGMSSGAVSGEGGSNSSKPILTT